MTSVTTRPQPWRKNLKGTIVVLVILTVLVAFVMPVIWMIMTSVKPSSELGNALSFPSKLSFDGYAKIGKFGLWKSFSNSMLVAVASSTISLLVAIFAAYGFSRRRFRGRNVLLFSVVLSQLFPFVMLVTPLYVIFGKIGLVNSYAGIIMAYVAITLPFSIYMLLGYLDSVPKSLDEAGELDGASTLGLIFRIIVPIAWPGMVVVWIYSFTLAWEEYLIASVLLASPDKRTLPVAIAGLFGEYTTEWDVVMSIGVVATVPTLLIFLILQKRLVGNLASGAVK